MSSFDQFHLKKQLRNAISDIGFVSPTPIQEQAFNVVLSGKDVLGIAQTGTGKTLAYSLPILEEMKYSAQKNPRAVILVPTRELVIQVVNEIERLTEYMSIRTLGIYGGVNIKTHRLKLFEGADIIVATPGRIYDLILEQSLSVKGVKKLVIDEVDVMLDLGFRPQLMNILELLPQRRQNIMFSATMTDHVDELIDDFFIAPTKISIAVSGTPLENIQQECYNVENFFTKVNLLKHLLKDTDKFTKVLVFAAHKRMADRIHAEIIGDFADQVGIIHSNKTQNYRIRSIEDFDSGQNRILVATDIMARGLDLDKISHVINFDTPNFPENYMHRIGRTGRAEEIGRTILFSTEKEMAWKEAIEELMDYKIPVLDFPEEVEVSRELLTEEKPEEEQIKDYNRNLKNNLSGPGTHEKKAKNKKVNLGGTYKRDIKQKYKKAQTRGDKTYHKKQKRG
ncbi:MAG: DEAD/DEAH box helicase [Crocinitomicaceae bacterium]|nr:DEAD/DEAH box helicase [Flavobacteriales bacterium]NQZ36761.1 DEAD/DEAH box helicase [Crocinitomicaceae bacterium]